MLAQLNFEETPRLEGFPEKGLLQFWIGDDEYFGADLDSPENQADFRVRFFPEIEKDTSRLRADFPDWASFDMPLPTDSSFSIDFEATEELMSVADFRFENEFGADFFEQFDKRSDAVWEEFEEISSAPGHKIGGYPHFSQEDPRFEEAHPPTVLLFQLDSDDEMDLMWGDAGVANFFIREADLARLDFSHVHFNWDCY